MSPDPVDKSVSCKSKNRAMGDTTSDWKNLGGVFKIPMEDTGGAEYDFK